MIAKHKANQASVDEQLITRLQPDKFSPELILGGVKEYAWECRKHQAKTKCIAYKIAKNMFHCGLMVANKRPIMIKLVKLEGRALCHILSSSVSI